MCAEWMYMFMVISRLVKTAHGFPNGAPTYQCANAYPHHGVSAQPYGEAMPYDLTVDKTTYSPEEEIKITIKGMLMGGTDLLTPFRGFHIRVMRVDYDQKEAVGEFTVYDDEIVRAQSWIPQLEYPEGTVNCLTHLNNEDKTELTVTWKAPSTNIGDIDIKVTMVKTQKVFWVDQTVRIESKSTGPTISPALEKSQVPSEEIKPPFFGDCGESKGCILYPSGCSGTDCSIAVSWLPDPDDKGTISFEMMAETEGYVALGLSADEHMGLDTTFTCLEKDGNMDIQYGFNNPDHSNDQHRRTNLIDLGVLREDGRLYCKFSTIMWSHTFIYEDLELSGQRDVFRYEFSMENDQYLFVARGPISELYECDMEEVAFTMEPNINAPGGEKENAETLEDCRKMCQNMDEDTCYGFDWNRVNKECWRHDALSNFEDRFSNTDTDLYMRRKVQCTTTPSMTFYKHDKIPLKSSEAVNILTNTDVTSGTQLPWYIKLHATLGLATWLTIAAFSIILARHYRFVCNCLCCGKGCWFHIHRFLMVLVTCSSIVIVALQFSYVKKWTEYASLHAILGLAVTIFCIVQMILGMCRPQPEAGSRTVFNWVHRITGFILFILAAVTIVLGLQVEILEENFRKLQTIIVLGWICFIVVWELLLECFSCCARVSGTISGEYSNKSETAGSAKEGKADDEEELYKYRRGGRRITIILFVFVLILFILIVLGALAWSIINLFFIY